jgi:hypothetical protein
VVKAFAVVAVLAVSLVGCSQAGKAPAAQTPRAAGHPASTSERSAATSYLGVYTPGVPSSYAPVERFAAAVGRQPNLVLYYSGWYESFNAAFAAAAEQHGAVPVIQIDPTGISMADIAAGRYDRYLRSFAQAVVRYGDKIVLSFGHEMNGDWYTWGWKNTPAAAFVAAWRHVHDVFAATGARKVTWMWTIIVGNDSAATLKSWWPGAAYVNWVGLDGYYVYPADTFATVFGGALSAVREITRDSVLLAETGVAPGAGKAAKLPDLFTGIRASGVIGFMYFDKDQNAASGYHQNWRLEDDPAAVAEFRRLAASSS